MSDQTVVEDAERRQCLYVPVFRQNALCSKNLVCECVIIDDIHVIAVSAHSNHYMKSLQYSTQTEVLRAHTASHVLMPNGYITTTQASLFQRHASALFNLCFTLP